MQPIETNKPIKFKTPFFNRGQNKDQDIARFLTSLPIWLLFVVIILACILLDSVGSVVGYLRFRSGVKIAEPYLGTAVGAILGLLAFMLGFTFSLTWTRFANRNMMVLQQAKAIETCYLRTSLIPEKQQAAIRGLLKEYLEVLLEVPTITNVDRTIALIDDLHRKLWLETASLATEDMDGELRSIFIASVNDIITAATERKTLALAFVIPDPIWFSLLVLSSIGMFAYGYQSGISGDWHFFQFPMLAIAFGLVIVLISELNASDMQSRFRVKREPLEYVRKTMESIT